MQSVELLFSVWLQISIVSTMILEGELSMATRLDFNDAHSDAGSVAPIILPRQARECTTPQKSFIIPFCVSVMQPLLRLPLEL
uniref:Secreted protein n=1 Tax=Setaria viridis TaxID=4556 RepID=A0A4U6UM20_SETVI|nr:hypothetical protein SEVIR_5G368250v2 [Setaria viridis]